MKITALLMFFLANVPRLPAQIKKLFAYEDCTEISCKSSRDRNVSCRLNYNYERILKPFKLHKHLPQQGIRNDANQIKRYFCYVPYLLISPRMRR